MMRFLCITVCCIAYAVASVEQEVGDDFTGRVADFFSRSETKATQMETTPSPGCVEGDMLLTPEQEVVYREMEEVTDENRERVQLDVANVFNVWPNNTLVYKYSPTLDAATKLRFEQAVEVYKEKTNIKFVEVIDGMNSTITPLTVRDDGKGCSSTVGFHGNRGGNLNLKKGSCDTLGLVLHELGHALGRFHEQSRSDRDQFVTVNESNIASGYESNFKIRDRPKVAPYDLQSVMHYGPWAYSRDGFSMTIIPHNPKDVTNMGRQEMLTRLDVYTLNVLYNAFDTCPDDLWSQCRRGGVPNKHCACDCLPAFEGPYCDIFAQPTACSEIRTDNAGTIQSPGYPNKYPVNSFCTYAIECADDEVVQLDYTEFSIEASGSYGCFFDKMTLFTGDLISECYGDEFCGDVLEGQQIVSGTHVAVMNFESDFMVSYPGFKIDYHCVPITN